MAPVAQRVQVAHVQALLQALGDVGEAAGDLAGHEGLAAARRLVVEEDAVAGIHAVGLAVVHRDPVGVELGHRVGRARVEGRGFLLRDLLHQAVQLGSGRLVEAGLLLQAQEADGLQQTQGADGIHVGGVLGGLETDRHVGLGTEVVHLVRLHFLEDAGQVGSVGQVAVVQNEVLLVDMRILVNVVDPLGVKHGGTALDTVHFVALFKQEFCKVGAVLAGDTGDKGAFGHVQSLNILINQFVAGEPGNLADDVILLCKMANRLLQFHDLGANQETIPISLKEVINQA